MERGGLSCIIVFAQTWEQAKGQGAVGKREFCPTFSQDKAKCKKQATVNTQSKGAQYDTDCSFMC